MGKRRLDPINRLVKSILSGPYSASGGSIRSIGWSSQSYLALTRQAKARSDQSAGQVNPIWPLLGKRRLDPIYRLVKSILSGPYSASGGSIRSIGWSSQSYLALTRQAKARSDQSAGQVNPIWPLLGKRRLDPINRLVKSILSGPYSASGGAIWSIDWLSQSLESIWLLWLLC